MDKQQFDAELAAVRREIDALDDRLVELLAQRLRLVRKVAELKSSTGLAPVHVPDREREVLARARADAARYGLDPALAERVFRAVLDEFRGSEQRMVDQLPAVTGK
jgi:chorismate mutase/prephenate dehydrogenase